MSILLVLIIAYAFLLVVGIMFPKRTLSQDHTEKIPSLTILIPLKDEANRIPRLIENLAKLNFKGLDVEVLFINDHSSDDSLDLLRNSGYFVHSLSVGHSGKKMALLEGVKLAKGEWILSWDADVEVHDDFSTILEALDTRKTKMFIFALRPELGFGDFRDDLDFDIALGLRYQF